MFTVSACQCLSIRVVELHCVEPIYNTALKVPTLTTQRVSQMIPKATRPLSSHGAPEVVTGRQHTGSC